MSNKAGSSFLAGVANIGIILAAVPLVSYYVFTALLEFRHWDTHGAFFETLFALLIGLLAIIPVLVLWLPAQCYEWFWMSHQVMVVAISVVSVIVRFTGPSMPTAAQLGRAAGQSKTKLRGPLDSILYFFLAPFLSSNTPSSRTIERIPVMNDPPNKPTPGQDEEQRTQRAFDEAQRKVDEQQRIVQAVVEQIRNEKPELLAGVDLAAIEKKGFFEALEERVNDRRLVKNIQEKTTLLRHVNALQKEELSLADNRTKAYEAKKALDKAKGRMKFTNLELQVEERELQSKLKKIDLDDAKTEEAINDIKNPPKPEPVSEVADPVKDKERELRLAEIQRDIERIKNPLEKPKASERIARKIAAIKELEAECIKQKERVTSEEERQRINRMFEDAIESVMEGEKA